MREDIGRDDFRELVEEALEGFPSDFRKLLENLAVVVEDIASPRETHLTGADHPMQLLGLYVGVPYTRWGRERFARPPDVIKIFRLPILAGMQPGEDIGDKIRRVVLHELGHRAGIGEERLRELGVY